MKSLPIAFCVLLCAAFMLGGCDVSTAGPLEGPTFPLTATPTLNPEDPAPTPEATICEGQLIQENGQTKCVPSGTVTTVRLGPFPWGWLIFWSAVLAAVAAAIVHLIWRDKKVTGAVAIGAFMGALLFLGGLTAIDRTSNAPIAPPAPRTPTPSPTATQQAAATAVEPATAAPEQPPTQQQTGTPALTPTATGTPTATQAVQPNTIAAQPTAPQCGWNGCSPVQQQAVAGTPAATNRVTGGSCTINTQDLTHGYGVNGRWSPDNPTIKFTWDPDIDAWLQVTDLTVSQDGLTKVVLAIHDTAAQRGTYEYDNRKPDGTITHVRVDWTASPGEAVAVINTTDIVAAQGQYGKGRAGHDFLVQLQVNGDGPQCSTTRHMDPTL